MKNHSSKIAVIADTRLDSFNKVVAKHFKYLSEEWKLMIFTDDLSKVGLPCLKARIEPIKDLHDYNRLLTSIKFWDVIPCEHVLIFQHDSELLREGIDEFLEWDYVGAAWNFQEHGGNGGLSLRTRYAMIRTIQQYPFAEQSKNHNEDTYFSNNLVGNLAPRNICQQFSVETVFGLGSLGCHAIDSHFSKEECEQIRTFQIETSNLAV